MIAPRTWVSKQRFEQTMPRAYVRKVYARLGCIVGSGPNPVAFNATMEVFRRHLAVFGQTQYGKSRFYQLLCRSFVENGWGFAFIDPHTDAGQDLFGWLAYRYPRLGLVREDIHLISPSECLFSFDPFKYEPDPHIPENQRKFRYRSWLQTKIKDVVNIIVRQQGETEDEKAKMVRLKRWLSNVLFAVGVRQDETGTHEPLSHALILLNPNDKRFPEVYRRVEPFLSPSVRADFEKLIAARNNPRWQEDWVESSINRLREFLSSEMVAAIFDLHRPSIDFHDIIRRGGVLIVTLGKTRDFDEGVVIAGLIIREITEAIRIVNRDERRTFGLFLDEAQNFINPDLETLMKESAKYKLVVGLGIQQLDNLRRGETDLVGTVLGMCGLRIAFRMPLQEEAEILAKNFFYPQLRFDPLLQEVDRDDGYEWVVTVTESSGESESTTVTRGHSTSESVSVGKTSGRTRTAGTSHSMGLNRSETDSNSHQHSLTLGVSESAGSTTTDTVVHTASRSADSSASSAQSRVGELGRAPRTTATAGERQAKGASDARGTNEGTSQSTQRSRQTADANGHTHGVTNGKSWSWGRNDGISESSTTTVTRGKTQTESLAFGNTVGTSHTTTYSPAPLKKTRTEVRDSGKLQRAVSEQVAKFTQDLMSPQVQHCYVSAASRCFLMRVDDVLDPFEEHCTTAEFRECRIAFLKRIVFSRPYCFQPSDAMLSRTPSLRRESSNDSSDETGSPFPL